MGSAGPSCPPLLSLASWASTAVLWEAACLPPSLDPTGAPAKLQALSKTVRPAVIKSAGIYFGVLYFVCLRTSYASHIRMTFNALFLQYIVRLVRVTSKSNINGF